jgi:alcohol dehydrogenase class IV
VHGFAAPLGANYPVPHGTVCAALLPHVIAANLRAGPREVLERYATIGRVLAGDSNLPADEAAQTCVQFTAALVKELGIPPLRKFGVAERDVSEMVGLARKASSMRFNPVVLSDETLAGVLLAGIRGDSAS